MTLGDTERHCLVLWAVGMTVGMTLATNVTLTATQAAMLCRSALLRTVETILQSHQSPILLGSLLCCPICQQQLLTQTRYAAEHLASAL